MPWILEGNGLTLKLHPLFVGLIIFVVVLKPSGKEGRRAFSDYFAHVISGSKRKNTMSSVRCSQGESLEHRKAKHWLREHINWLSFAIERCITCGMEKVLNFVECTVKLEINSSDKRWRYDCLVYDNEGTKFYVLEVAYTHFSSTEKIRSTRHSGLGIAEFLVEDIMALSPTNGRIKNLLCENICCETCNRRSIHDAILQHYEQEILTWLEFEDIVFDSLLEAFKCIEFQRSLTLIESISDRAKAVLEEFQNKIWVRSGRLWKICLKGRISRSLSGFIIDVSNDSRIPANAMFLMVIERTWESGAAQKIHMELGKIWEKHSICQDLVYAVCCDTILNRVGSLQQNDFTIFNCCLFAILKTKESQYQICANCGTHGHTSVCCKRLFCTRCGRGGHSFQRCYARTSVTGDLI
jgi:hypothetical protein